MRARAKTFCSEAWPWASLDASTRLGFLLVPIRFASEACSWASLDEPRSASGSCSCEYVLPPKPGFRASFDELPSTSGLGAHQYALASMSLEAPQLRGLGQALACARANLFCLRGLSLGKFR